MEIAAQLPADQAPPGEAPGRRFAPLLAGLTAAALTGALCWPLPLWLDEVHLPGSFHDGHVWCFDHIHAMLTGAAPWSWTTDRIGFPASPELRFIAWAPALLAAALRTALGPLGAYNAVVLLSPALSAAAAAWGIRRAVGAGHWAAAGAGVAFALCPYALGVLASGQTAKLQLWILPLWLGLLSGALDGRRRDAAALAPLTAIAALTSPSTTAWLPILGGIWIAAAGPTRWPQGLTALALSALGAAPAWLYYSAEPALAAFLPATPPPQGAILTPPQIAQPETILLGPTIEPKAGLSYHVPYLGIPALVGAALLSLRRAPGRGAAWALIIAGIALSLGPALATGGAFIEIAGRGVPAPAALLEAIHYPTSRSGMYYRAIALASLGLSLLLASAASRLPRGGALAWGLGLLLIADGLRVTRPIWPRTPAPLDGAAALAEMAADPEPGAVLNLPMWVGDQEGGTYLLLSLLHRRPTTGLPRDLTQVEHLRELDGLLRRIGSWQDPERGRAALAEEGFRYVLFTPWFPYSKRNVPYSQLLHGLGTPKRDGDLYWWELDPRRGPPDGTPPRVRGAKTRPHGIR